MDAIARQPEASGKSKQLWFIAAALIEGIGHGFIYEINLKQ
jgi:F0F1-type ATP synthase membrane subunit c/vacuolar-type H+-ATPase subunit K